MKKNGRSFYLASLFFPKVFFRKVNGLYALCRWIDDAADEAPTLEKSHQELTKIIEDLHQPKPSLLPNRIYKESQLNPGYIDDLISGAKADLGQVRIQNEKELIQYCYKVAGTVGLAMSDLMHVDNPKARAFAVDLGIAMQITNICRDIREDAQKGRIYIPETFLQKHHIAPKELLSLSVSSAAISGATKDLLALGETYYESARKAFVHIPWRMRGAIIVASYLYRGIGQKLKRKGGDPMLGRTFLSPTEKTFKLFSALGLWLSSTFWARNISHQATLHQHLQAWKGLREFPS